MMSIKGHFDGAAVILDEPATLAVGQPVRVIADDGSSTDANTSPRPSRFGFARGMFKMSEDFNDPLDDFAEYR